MKWRHQVVVMWLSLIDIAASLQVDDFSLKLAEEVPADGSVHLSCIQGVILCLFVTQAEKLVSTFFPQKIEELQMLLRVCVVQRTWRAVCLQQSHSTNTTVKVLGSSLRRLSAVMTWSPWRHRWTFPYQTQRRRRPSGRRRRRWDTVTRAPLTKWMADAIVSLHLCPNLWTDLWA